jgi:hypothetical protein
MTFAVFDERDEFYEPSDRGFEAFCWLEKIKFVFSPMRFQWVAPMCQRQTENKVCFASSSYGVPVS